MGFFLKSQSILILPIGIYIDLQFFSFQIVNSQRVGAILVHLLELLALSYCSFVVNYQENIVDFNRRFQRGDIGCRLNLEEKLLLGQVKNALQDQERGLNYENRQSFNQQVIYMPSEQWGYSDKMTGPSDIYSLLAKHS